MGTPGFYGVKINGDIKVSYSRFDSNPEFMGLKMFRAARRIVSDCDNYRNRAEQLQLVVRHMRVPPAIHKRLARLQHFNPPNTDRWCDALHALESDLLGVLDTGYMVDCVDEFHTDTSWRWSWVVNFDDNVFDCWDRKTDVPPSHDRSTPITRYAFEHIHRVRDTDFVERMYRVSKESIMHSALKRMSIDE